LDTIIVSSKIASDLVILITLVATILFLAVGEVTDVHGKPSLALFSRQLNIITAPLIILFIYIAVIKLANVLA
jgi:hypothetical protein